MKEFYYTVKDPIGMHARPATQLVNTVKGLASVVTVEKQGKKADARKLLALMSLAVAHGDEVHIVIEGEDENIAEEKVISFFEENLLKKMIFIHYIKNAQTLLIWPGHFCVTGIFYHTKCFMRMLDDILFLENVCSDKICIIYCFCDSCNTFTISDIISIRYNAIKRGYLFCIWPEAQ